MQKAVITFFLSLLIVSFTSIFLYTASASASVNNTRIAGSDFIDDAIQISIRSGLR